MILLDLFSGIGGFHKGLSDAGFKFTKTYFSEIDRHAIANYKYNFQNKNIEHIGSVTDILTRGMERPNVITAGSPCQDFSLAGKRAGLDGERSSLIEYFLSAISHFRPDVFIWENVKGAFSSNNSEDFWAIIQAFANIGGYHIEWQLLNTAWLLPQNRERIYLVGRIADRCRGEIFPIGEDDELFREKGKSNERRTQAEYCTTIKQGFGNKADDTFVKVGTFRTHNDGKGFRQVKSKVCPTIPARAREDGSGMSVISSFTRDAKGKVVNRNDRNICNTITSATGGGGNTDVFVNNIRRLTEIECERLQGSPDDFTKYGIYDDNVKEIPMTQRYKLLGNAVTAKMVELVGSKIIQNTTL